jgi:hypothetical protein
MRSNAGRFERDDGSHFVLMTAAAFLMIFSFYLRFAEGADLVGVEQYTSAIAEALRASE